MKGTLSTGVGQVSASGQTAACRSLALAPLPPRFFLPAPTPYPPAFQGDKQDAEETEGWLRVSRLWCEIDFHPAT